MIWLFGAVVVLGLMYLTWRFCLTAKEFEAVFDEVEDDE